MEYNQYLNGVFNELCKIEEGGINGRMGRRKYKGDESAEFKSPNLHSERRRREKLSQRLLTLRSLVPIITNMNKATIIQDAITYITELQKNEKVLIDQLLEVESSCEQEQKPSVDENGAEQEMEKNEIKADIQVANVDGNKMWMKIITQKKRGSFTKLMEGLSAYGFELTDTCVTTSKGAMLISSFIEGAYGKVLAATQTKELLGQIISCI